MFPESEAGSLGTADPAVEYDERFLTRALAGVDEIAELLPDAPPDLRRRRPSTVSGRFRNPQARVVILRAMSSLTPGAVPGMEPERLLAAFTAGRDRLSRFMMSYQFAIQGVETKLSILRQEFEAVHRYNPIEHVSSRLKKPEDAVAKARRRGYPLDEASIAAAVRDIAGVRVVCTFIGDVFRIQQMLCAQDDVTLLELKDYVTHPKPSGYRSLHAIVTIPVYLTDRVESVPVEIQFRTIAQDFWASLEHKIFYKYGKQVPGSLSAELIQAAGVAADLDAKMERLAHEIDSLSDDGSPQVSDHAVRQFLEFVGGSRQAGPLRAADHEAAPGAAEREPLDER